MKILVFNGYNSKIFLRFTKMKAMILFTCTNVNLINTTLNSLSLLFQKITQYFKYQEVMILSLTLCVIMLVLLTLYLVLKKTCFDLKKYLEISELLISLWALCSLILISLMFLLYFLGAVELTMMLYQFRLVLRRFTYVGFLVS